MFRRLSCSEIIDLEADGNAALFVVGDETGSAARLELV
jgi:hypothetical protein